MVVAVSASLPKGVVRIVGLSTNKNGESFSEAFKRGYRENRDYRRQKLNEGYKEAPLLTRSAEVAGAVASPVRFFKAPKTAPLGMKAKKELLNDMTAGIMYGMGSGQDTVKDHAAKMAIGGTTSYLGSNWGNQIYGRGAYPTPPSAPSISSAQPSDNP